MPISNGQDSGAVQWGLTSGVVCQTETVLCKSIPIMLPIQFSLGGVEKLLKGLDINKAGGPDGISTRVLKEAATELNLC